MASEKLGPVQAQPDRSTIENEIVRDYRLILRWSSYGLNALPNDSRETILLRGMGGTDADGDSRLLVGRPARGRHPVEQGHRGDASGPGRRRSRYRRAGAPRAPRRRPSDA